MVLSEYLVPLLILFGLLNLAGFVMMGRDKHLARQTRWRIPEIRFFGLALVGGALGIWLGMQVFRHKTKHKRFVWGIPALFVVNLLLFYELWKTFVES